jgi:signal transduction histidine kinase
LRIQILPPWWESLWFLSICIVFSFTALWLLYRRRLNQVTAEIRSRMEERLDERERIARELHNTLLQGALSASIQLDLAEDQLAKDSPVRGLVQNVLATLRQVTEEGRMALWGLRFQDIENNDLPKVFQRLKQEFPLKDTIVFQVVAQGAARRQNSDPERNLPHWTGGNRKRLRPFWCSDNRSRNTIRKNAVELSGERRWPGD